MARRDQRHDYRRCPDEDCPQFPCRVYKEGYRDGYAQGAADGYAAGEADGYAAGYSAGMDAGVRASR